MTSDPGTPVGGESNREGEKNRIRLSNSSEKRGERRVHADSRHHYPPAPECVSLARMIAESQEAGEEGGLHPSPGGGER